MKSVIFSYLETSSFIHKFPSSTMYCIKVHVYFSWRGEITAFFHSGIPRSKHMALGTQTLRGFSIKLSRALSVFWWMSGFTFSHCGIPSSQHIGSETVLLK